MAKEAGLGFAVTIDDNGGTARIISNDITSLDLSTPRAMQDVTGVNKSAVERLLLLADFSATYRGVFNDAVAPSAHDTFKTVPSTSVARTCTNAISGQTLAGELFLTDYQLARPQTGELTFTVPAVLSDGTIPTWT